MDNFPTTVPHFLTSSTSTSTSTTSSSPLIHSKQPKIMAATTTTTTHDDSHNSHFISSNYTSPQFCYAAPTYWGHQDHQGRRHQFPAGSGSVHQPAAAHRSGMAYHPFMMATGRQTSGGGVLVGVSEEQERRLLDAWTTKVARSKRRMARQRSLNLVTTQSSPPPSSSTNHHAVTSVSTATTLGEYTREQPISGSGDRDLYTFCTPDKKRLRILLKKELKNSDVGSLGRIVLPKREAEEKLPTLSDKEGIQVVMRDVYSNREWSLRYKYWSNNKSRMYVLENTGEFVKQNGLEIGDSIALYEDECKNLYISMKKGTKAGTECSQKRHLSNQKITVNDNNNLNNSNSNSTTTSSDEVYDIHNKAIANSKTSADHENSFLSGSYDALEEVARDEEDVSLALLIEQLNHKEQQEANTLDTTLSHIEYGNNNDSSSISYNDVVISCSEGMPSSDQTKIEEAVQPAPCQPSPWWRSFDEHFEDCYGGLDTLPEVGQYEYYGTSSTLFDHRFMSDN